MTKVLAIDTADMAAGQWALLVTVFVLCIATCCYVTWLADEIRHDRRDRERRQ